MKRRFSSLEHCAAQGGVPHLEWRVRGASLVDTPMGTMGEKVAVRLGDDSRERWSSDARRFLNIPPLVG